MERAGAAAALALCLVWGCTNSRPYPGLPEKNLRVRAVAAGGRVALDIYSVGSRCATTYEGFVVLDQPMVEVGLPVGKPSLLVFEFHSSGPVSSIPIRKEWQLLPRAGYRYEARATYKESIYDIELREIDPSTGTNRELDTPRSC